MKSLVEEASSITKAIEKAWIRAGQPQSFSVKIFETPEVGFLGFVKKSAKVGIFFEEPAPERTKNHYSRPANKRTNRKPSEYKPRTNTPRRELKEDSQERETRRPAPRRQEDRRDTRPASRRRENNREASSTDERPALRPRRSEQARPTREVNSRTERQEQARPTRETNSRPEQARPERPSRPERPAPERAPASKPAQKAITPVSKPQEAATPEAPATKRRAPKISGRRFSGHKKDKPEGS